MHRVTAFALLLATTAGCSLFAGFSSAPTAPGDGAAEGGDAGADGEVGPEAGFVLEARDEVCNANNWCWLNPLPHGETVWGIWGVGDTLWACGEQGLLMRKTGDRWQQLRPPLLDPAPVPGIGLVALFDIWGRSASELYVVGALGAVARHDGSLWYVERSGGEVLTGVWGPADGTAVYAVGSVLTGDGVRGVVLRRTGASWHSMDLPDDTNGLLAVHGRSASHVTAVGVAGTIVRWDGSAWSALAGGPPTALLAGVWDDGAGGVYAVGSKNSGQEGVFVTVAGDDVSHVSLSYPLSGVWGRGPSEIYTVGYLNKVLRFDGSGWNPLTPDYPAPAATLLRVWGDGDRIYVAGTGGSVGRRQGSGWDVLAPTSKVFAEMRAVWSAGRDHAMVAGADAQLLAFDGQGLASVANAPVDSGELFSVWGFSESAYFVGEIGRVARFGPGDAFGWEDLGGGKVTALWGAGSTADPVYAGGVGALYQRKPEGTWFEPIGMPGTVSGLWGRDATRIVATLTDGTAGQTCLTRRLAVTTWVSECNSGAYRGAWGPREDLLFVAAVDDSGAHLLSPDPAAGGTLAPVFSVNPGPPRFGPIWGRNATEAWAVGDDGLLVRFDGATWKIEPALPGFVDARAIAGNSDGQLFVVGVRGVVLVRRP